MRNKAKWLGIGLGLVLGVWPAWAQQAVVTQPISRASGNVSSTIASTGVFQSLWGQSAARAGCLIENNGTHNMDVFFGAIAGATAAKSVVLAAGQALNCSTSGVSATDAVSITGTSGDAFAALQDGAPVVTSQAGSGGGGGSNVTIVGPLGQALMAASIPVAIASDQSAVTVAQATAANLNAQVVGNVASGAGEAGNPVGIGGSFNTTPTAITNGQRGEAQLDANSNFRAAMTTTVVTGADGVSNASVASPYLVSSSSTSTRMLAQAPFLFNGTAWDRWRSDTGVTGSAAVTEQPSASTGASVASVVSSAVESNHVIKNSAGNLYGFEVTTGATAGWVFVSNTTTAPAAAGAAIAPIKCYLAPANSTLAVAYNPAPLQLSTGITLVFSTTGCFVNTASATAFFSGDAK